MFQQKVSIANKPCKRYLIICLFAVIIENQEGE